MATGSTNFEAMNIEAAATNWNLFKYLEFDDGRLKYGNVYLKLSLTNINLAEESVHQVTSDEKDVDMAALVTTYLKINNILIIRERERESFINWSQIFYQTRAVKL